MTIVAPTAKDFLKAGEALGISMSETDAIEFVELVSGLLEGYRLVDSLPDNKPLVNYPRTPGYQPQGEENIFNAWACKSTIYGAENGKLKGKKIAIKDNICVAGVPMMNGSSLLEDYVPEMDATVVTRILDAGGEIVGKASCEYLSASGGSHTMSSGLPVRNPWNTDYTTGGSSSGCAALVAAGEVDMAVGADQAGSIRIPASFCGIVGMKPTFGLVPYTGIMAVDMTIDHAGPMTANVADNALLLEAIAGEDGFDPRQNAPQTASYTDALDTDEKGLRIGVLREGFGHPNSEPDVDEKVRNAAGIFEKIGVEVQEISVPMHLQSQAIWTPIGVEGIASLLLANGTGTNWRGLYSTSMLDAMSSWRTRVQELPDSFKYVLLLGQHMLTHHRGRFYAKAQNLARCLSAAYDRALESCDVLLMPTLPIKATPLPPKDAPRQLVVQRAHEMFANTAAFDITSHPALSMPCGIGDGLPIGMMLVGKKYDEFTIYRLASAFERIIDWETL